MALSGGQMIVRLLLQTVQLLPAAGQVLLLPAAPLQEQGQLLLLLQQSGGLGLLLSGRCQSGIRLLRRLSQGLEPLFIGGLSPSQLLQFGIAGLHGLQPGGLIRQVPELRLPGHRRRQGLGKLGQLGGTPLLRLLHLPQQLPLLVLIFRPLRQGRQGGAPLLQCTDLPRQGLQGGGIGGHGLFQQVQDLRLGQPRGHSPLGQLDHGGIPGLGVAEPGPVLLQLAGLL